MNPEENKFKWSLTENDPFLWPKEYLAAVVTSGGFDW